MKIIYLADRVVRAQELASALQDNNVFCEVVDVRRILGLGSLGVFNAPLIGKKYRLLSILKKIREFAPDLVISDTVSLVNVFPLISKFTESIPLCVRLRGNFWDEVKQRRTAQKTFANFSRCLLVNSLGNFCLKISDAIFPVCEYLRRVTLEHISAPNKIFSVFNGVNTTRFNLTVDGSIFKQKYDLENKKLIVCVSNFNFPEKVRGISYFLPVIKRVLSTYKDITFVIIGGGLYHSNLKNAIKRCNLSSRVIMTGFIREVEHVYAAAHILFYPSFHDSLPTVLLEASASGRPIIASKVGGIPEIILNNKTGFLFDPYDKKTLGKCFVNLLEDEPLKRKLGNNARKRIEDRFNWPRIGKRLSRMLHSLIQR